MEKKILPMTSKAVLLTSSPHLLSLFLLVSLGCKPHKWGKCYFSLLCTSVSHDESADFDPHTPCFRILSYVTDFILWHWLQQYSPFHFPSHLTWPHFPPSGSESVLSLLDVWIDWLVQRGHRGEPPSRCVCGSIYFQDESLTHSRNCWGHGVLSPYLHTRGFQCTISVSLEYKDRLLRMNI